MLTVPLTQGLRRTCVYRYASSAHADNPPSFACRRLDLYELRMLCREMSCQWLQKCIGPSLSCRAHAGGVAGYSHKLCGAVGSPCLMKSAMPSKSRDLRRCSGFCKLYSSMCSGSTHASILCCGSLTGLLLFAMFICRSRLSRVSYPCMHVVLTCNHGAENQDCNLLACLLACNTSDSPAGGSS